MINNDFQGEVKRKAFHLFALAFPITYIFIPKLWMILCTVIAISLPVYIDISRHYNSKVQGLVKIFFVPFMREGEENGNFKLSGVTYMMAGVLVTVLFFPKAIAIVSLIVLVLADSAAALIGRKVGGESFANGKTVAGCAAFFVTAFTIAMFAQVFFGLGATFSAIICASFVSTIVELYSKELRVNDNFSIPVSFAITLSLVSLI